MEPKKVTYIRTLEEYDDGFQVNQYSTLYGCGYNLPSIENVEYLVSGIMKDDEDFGEILNITYYEEIIPTSMEGIMTYMETLDGLPALKKSLCKKYKKKALEILKTPKDIKNGFEEDHIYRLAGSFASRSYAKDVFKVLAVSGVPLQNQMRVYLSSENILDTLQENPYSIIGYGMFSFENADRLAKFYNLPKDSTDRMRAAVETVLKSMESGSGVFQDAEYPDEVLDANILKGYKYKVAKNGWYTTYAGGTCLPVDICYITVMKLLGEPIPKKTFLRGIAENKNVFSQDGFVYGHSLAKAEYNSAKKLAKMSKQNFAVSNIYEVVYDAEAEKEIKLSLEQGEAVRTALTSPVSIITGGPGTGKTSVQKVLIEAFTKISDKPVVLLSPTGKAAKRMTESTGYPASTIHKAIGLGYYGEVRKDVELKAGLIIVDEASMIDARLLDILVSKIPDRCRVVFVGDIDQLPSVGAGTVLHSLIESGLPVSRLTITFRQSGDSNIADDAARVRLGDPNITYANDVQFIEGDKDISKLVAKAYIEAVKRDGIENVCCLTAFKRSTKTGSNKLNALLREALYGDTLTKKTYVDGNPIYVGDRVMFTSNQLGLVNGDIGVVKDIYKGSIVCDFDGNVVTISDEHRKSLEPAYALTVHKSQGSEYKTVILVMDNKHKRMLKRNLVYTGITRAKKNLVFVGEKSAFKTAVLTKDNQKRTSRLASLIKSYAAE